MSLYAEHLNASAFQAGLRLMSKLKVTSSLQRGRASWQVGDCVGGIREINDPALWLSQGQGKKGELLSRNQFRVSQGVHTVALKNDEAPQP